MTRPLVYLAGPISGLTYEQAEQWRRDFAARLSEHGIASASPLRCEWANRDQGVLSPNGSNYADHPLLQPRAIASRNRFDATRCNLILVNLLHADRVSIGTMIEFGWADAHRIPVVLVAPEGPHPHDHMILNELTAIRCSSLDDALEAVVAILK